MVSSRVSCCFTSSEPCNEDFMPSLFVVFLFLSLRRAFVNSSGFRPVRWSQINGDWNCLQGGETWWGWVGNVRGRAAAGDLLLINEPLDALGACSCETAALRSAKNQERVARRCSRSRFDRSWTDNCQRAKSTKKKRNFFFHSLLALELNTKRRHSRVLLLRQTGAHKMLSPGSSFSKYACLASLTGAVGSLQLCRTTNVQNNRCI